MGLDPRHLIDTFGLIGIWAIVFAESGLGVGFFLPGDALLFFAGFLASGPASLSDLPHLNIGVLIVGIVVCSIAGNQLGFVIGQRLGPSLFNRESGIFKKSRVDKAHEFFERHGSQTIVLARFVPIVRAFAPLVAGASKMDAKAFTKWNVIGGIGWGTGVTLLGYFLGQVDFIAENIELTIVAVVAVSCLPILFEVVKHRREIAAAADGE